MGTIFQKRIDNRCFCCLKELFVEVHQHDDGKTSETVYDGGYADLKFHYGSDLDQCHGFGGRKDDRPEETSLARILTADLIELLICDNCFKARWHLCDGYDTIDYAPIKAEQHQNLIEIGQWLMSPEGQAEMEEVKKQAEAEEAEQKQSELCGNDFQQVS